MIRSVRTWCSSVWISSEGTERGMWRREKEMEGKERGRGMEEKKRVRRDKREIADKRKRGKRQKQRDEEIKTQDMRPNL